MRDETVWELTSGPLPVKSRGFAVGFFIAYLFDCENKQTGKFFWLIFIYLIFKYLFTLL